MSLVRIQKRGQITIPSGLRAQLKLADGDLVEARIRSASIVLTPKAVVDRSRVRSEEHSPARRQAIDARLEESTEDIKRERVYGPFESAEEMIASMRRQLRLKPAAGRSRRAR